MEKDGQTVCLCTPGFTGSSCEQGTYSLLKQFSSKILNQVFFVDNR